MEINVKCDYCGNVKLDCDMGFFCGKCGDCIDDYEVISTLCVLVQELSNRVQALENVYSKK